MKELNQKNNFIYLFLSLIVFLFSAAVVAEYPASIGEDIFSIVTMLMLIVSIKSLKSEKTWMWAVYTLIVLFILFTASAKFFEHQVTVYVTLSILLIFFTGSFLIAAKQVLLVGDIDGNKIIGSLSLYLLLGLIWAVLYLMLIVLDPGAFSGVEASTWQQGFSRIAYYSFVTLTTLGYGDVLPTSHVAEFFVYMEAIIGVFYMAIIVSSLISLRLSAMQDEKQNDTKGK
ncbi:MAG: potassium channel family protein [Campylobacterota bacterium]|nr:potassium channel family protein [Campylobacterota bacterium]